MSCKTKARLTSKKGEEIEECLEIYLMYEGKSLQEAIAGAMIHAFLGTVEHEIDSQSSGPLPPK